MPKWFRIIIILFLLLSALFAGILFFGYRIVAGSLPKTEGTVLVDGPVSNDISLYRDGYGIPHIIAGSRYDLFFAQGYATAQDRLWQMELSRRTACGELAEVFGSDMIRTDLFMRSIGIKAASENNFLNVSPVSRDILQAYADGVNCYIKNQGKRLPVEFRLLNFQPGSWEPWHSLAVLYSFSWSMNDRFMNDLLSGVLSEHGAHVFADQRSSKMQKTGTVFTDFLNTADSLLYTALPLYAGCTSAFSFTQESTQPGHTVAGFNYISPALIPSPWYEIHLASSDMNVSGLSVPGVPLVLTGQNTSIAWIYLDAEKNEPQIMCAKDKSNTYTRHKETIRSIGDSLTLVSIETSVQGPVFYKHPVTGQRLIYKTSPADFNDDILILNTAASSEYCTPSISDSRMSGGRMLALTGPGKTGQFSPLASGPDNAVYASSPLIEKYIHIKFISDSSSSMTKAKKTLSCDYSPEADSIIRSVLPALKQYIPLQDRPNYSHALSMLQQWNGTMKTSMAEPTIANTFIVMLARDILTSFLGADTYLLYSRFSLVPYHDIMTWLSTKPVQQRGDIIGRTFCQALDSLENRYGPDMNKWSWGIDHTVTFSHLMGTNPLLSSALNLGPFPVSGSGSSVSPSGSFLEYHPRADIFSSARAVYDISDANNSISAVSTGQSGQPVDEHYRDQAMLSIKNHFHPVLLDTAKISKTGWKRLILKKDFSHE